LGLFVHAVRPLAAVSAHGLPALAAGVDFGLGSISESFRHPGTVAAGVCHPDRPAEAVLDAGCPVALVLSFEVTLPVFPAEQGRVLVALTAAENARGLPSLEAGNGIAGCGACAAAPPGDTSLPHTAADRQGAAHALAQSCAATDPIPFVAAPSQAPSDDPSGGAHPHATRESTPAAVGSSARGCAG